MCYSKRSFDIIDRQNSEKGKILLKCAEDKRQSLTYLSSFSEVQEYFKLRDEYWKYVYGEKPYYMVGLSG
jgi:hypothetical protein